MSEMANTRESVEVLIVSYNCRNLLNDCLASIEANRPEMIELSIAVHDNGSTDGTPEMVAERFGQVRLVRSSTNLGFARANNELARTSSTDYVMLLNADTLWKDDVVTPLLECLRADPQTIAVGPKLIFPDGRRQASNRRLPTLLEEFAGLLETVLRGVGAWTDRFIAGSVDVGSPIAVDFLWATCWLMRRNDIEANGLFNEEFMMYDEDTDFCARMRAAGRKFVYQPKGVVIHIGGGSASPVVRGEYMRVSREQYYRKRRGPVAALAYHMFITIVAFVGRFLHRERH